MVTSRLPDSTGAGAPAAADLLPAGFDGAAVEGVAGLDGVIETVGVAATVGVTAAGGVALPDAPLLGVSALSPHATSAPEHTSIATPATHFTLNMLLLNLTPRSSSG
ncbi:hypothetical protein ACIG87_14215 [Micromonospora sp. NPDC051925]|uniref:hypothetical protein n=1 Tax=Micromonospora sp. NPDC051925 TaxID=3364288 RepID=UPI0037CAA41C